MILFIFLENIHAFPELVLFFFISSKKKHMMLKKANDGFLFYLDFYGSIIIFITILQISISGNL